MVGAIEYGIMAGTFRDDIALPSVRALSKQLGVAQLTVSNAYQTLKGMGLIETIAGKGTYVVRNRQETPHQDQVAQLQLRFKQLLQDAANIGLSESFFIGALNQTASPDISPQVLKMALVGNSNRINLSYIESIQEVLGHRQTIDTYTFREFADLAQEQLDSYQFWLTIPHCIPRLRLRVAESTPIFAPYLIPSEETRTRLAQLSADTGVLLVSRYQTFLPAMLEGVKNFAPHLGKIDVIALEDEGLAASLTSHRTLIYSTGCHSHLQPMLPATSEAFEYRHTPEPRYLRETLRPAWHHYCQHQEP
ncbi:GntR family transcriptional regulator [Serratia marcescens]|uniref:GntR family transcriptional regulator n=1 Tax=Serratia marcescens TaxID=615 RepID=UPI0032047F90